MNKSKLYYYYYSIITLIILDENYFLANCQNITKLFEPPQSQIETNDGANIIRGQCYITNNQTNTSWALVWADEFNDVKQFKENWDIDHKIRKCQTPISCHRRSNVQLHHGYLVIEAIQEPYYARNFTSGMVTSKQHFTEGRYEVRAAMPVGRMIRTCITTFNNASRKMNYSKGNLMLACHVFSFNFFSSIIYSDASLNHYREPDRVIEEGLSKFHLFGVEWNQDEVRFFFDHHYEEAIKVNETSGINQMYKINLIVLIADEVNGPPDNFQDLAWKCPALIVDYIRIYKNITNPAYNSNQFEKLPKCKQSPNGLNITNEEESKIVNDICSNSLAKSLKGKIENNIANSNVGLSTFLFVTLGIVAFFLLLITCLLVGLFKMKHKKSVASELHHIEFRGHEKQDNHYDVPVYEN